MKRNVRFFTIVISLLVASSLVLTGCMYVIAADKGETRAYDLKEQASMTDDNVVLTDAPLAQTEMQKKFGVYLHEEGGNIVTVFSEEQYTNLKAVRENGERIPLTYDEILFLMNDTIRIYFKYDEIRLYNAVVDGISHKQYVSSNAEIIYPYHGDYSEFETYDDAYAQYENMLEDIYSIIYYRIYVHDAGFEEVIECSIPDVIFAEGSAWKEASSIVPEYQMQLLSLNGGKVSGDENRELLVGEWEKIAALRKHFEMNSMDDTYVLEKLEAPLLTVFHYVYTETPMFYPAPMPYQLFVTNPNNLQMTNIYPTEELIQLMPRQAKTYISGNVNDDDWGPQFALVKESGEFSMNISSYQSFSLCGTYTEHDGVLKLYPENVAHDMEGYYSYVFYYENGAYVYSREDSVPPGGAFDIEDGLIFRLLEVSAHSSPSERPVQNIKDYAAEEGIPTDAALEPFFEDENYIYSFPSIRSEYVIVTFADGTEMPVKEALEKGYISIRALSVHAIAYRKEAKN